MRFHCRTGFGIFCVLALATGAQAQDLTAHDWSGVYLGASIGGVGGSGKVEATTSDGFVGSYFTSPDPEQIAATVAGPLSQWRATGGVFAGYGQQWDNLYLAVEGSANSLSFDGSRSSGAVYLSNPDGQFTHRLSATADWQATVRARLGLAQDRWLGYVTGGAAVTRIKLDATFADDFLGAGAAGHSASDDTVLGFVLGSGGEYALNDRWTARVEYLYADYGKVSTSSVVTNPAFPVFSNDLDTSFRFRTHTISVGLHHRF